MEKLYNRLIILRDDKNKTSKQKEGIIWLHNIYLYRINEIEIYNKELNNIYKIYTALVTIKKNNFWIEWTIGEKNNYNLLCSVETYKQFVNNNLDYELSTQTSTLLNIYHRYKRDNYFCELLHCIPNYIYGNDSEEYEWLFEYDNTIINKLSQIRKERYTQYEQERQKYIESEWEDIENNYNLKIDYAISSSSEDDLCYSSSETNLDCEQIEIDCEQINLENIDEKNISSLSVEEHNEPKQPYYIVNIIYNIINSLYYFSKRMNIFI